MTEPKIASDRDNTGDKSVSATPDKAETENQILKLVLEVGPLAIFFIGNAKFGIFAATAAFMVAIALSLTVSRMVFGKLAIMPMVTGVFVLLFGGLTLWLQDDTFIKLKPTIVNLIFASIMLGGLYFNKLIWKLLFADAFQLTDEGWRKLQLLWGIFFILLAGLNEFVWRNYDTDTWVNFKVFGIMPLTFLFSLALLPIMMRHQISDDSTGENP